MIGRCILPDFTADNKATDTVVVESVQTNRSMEQNRASRCKLTLISSIDFSIKVPKQFSGKCKDFATNGGGKSGHSYGKVNQT